MIDDGRQVHTGASVVRVWVFLAVIGFFLLSCLVVSGYFYRATLPTFGMHNEGWNAFHARSLWRGEPLYPAPTGLVTNNYPPLSFIATALLMHVVPDAVFAGRLIAAAAFLVVVGLVGLLVRRDQGDRLAGLFAGTLLAACFFGRTPDYIAANDPQMLAHAVSLCALVVLMRGRGAAAVILAASLFVTSLFIKHNIIALPIATWVFLMLHDRGRAMIFALAGIGFSIAGLAVCYCAFGPDFMANLLHPRQYSVRHVWYTSLQSLVPSVGLLVMVGLVPMVRSPSPLVVLGPVYLSIAAAVGVAASGGEGVAENAFFDLYIAAALLGGCLVARGVSVMGMRADVFRIWAVLGLILAAILGPRTTATRDVLMLPGWVEYQRQRAAQTISLVQVIRQQPGPVLCVAPIFCYWAGKDFEVDFFNFNQAIVTGRMTDAPLRQRITQGFYGAIVLATDQESTSGLGSVLLPGSLNTYRFQNDVPTPVPILVRKP